MGGASVGFGSWGVTGDLITFSRVGQTGAKLRGVRGVRAGDRDNQSSRTVDNSCEEESRKAVMSGIS